ncbi:MAG: hypothetical protein EXX96DRAFT_586385 [Benjaminiella poitrasii]|nr:MAG: hypothetical protein EXX96DRAFT_586385 [Benjaminiella poitrasii]
MASFFFEDYHFPSELYNKETGDFTTPIRTLLDFAPYILEELPKKEQDQKPMKSNNEDSWTKNYVQPGYLTSLLKSDKARSVAEFVIRCGNEYMKSKDERDHREKEFKQFEARYKKEKRQQRKQNRHHGWFFNNRDESSTSEEDEEEVNREQALKEEKRKKELQTKEQKQVLALSTTRTTLVKSAAAASVLSLSLYSTYQASVRFNEISFHQQLEVLITQVQSIIQSTEVWIEEHDKMNDKFPNQVKTDVIQLKQLVDYLIRLDPRSHKKLEAAGWGCGALGGLSALGGIVLGSATAITGGAALALGGAIVMISSKASSKSQLGARLLLENQVRERVAACQKSKSDREQIIENEFNKEDRAKLGDKRKIKEGGTKVTDKKVKHEFQQRKSFDIVDKENNVPKRQKEKVALA